MALFYQQNQISHNIVWTDGRMDGWMDRLLYIQISLMLR